jgi:hypothetical protein
LSPSTIGLLSELYGFSVRLLSQNFSSKMSHFIGFISKLKKEGFSGYIELRFPADEKQAIIFFKEGKIKAILREELLADLKEESEAELKFIRFFIEKAQKTGVQYQAFATY